MVTMRVDEDREWTVDGFLAEIAAVEANPPKPPPGIERVECAAGHWPMYLAHVDGMHPGHCLFCERDDLDRSLRQIRCEREHRQWKAWGVWARLSSHLYVLGITSSGGGTHYGRCEFCGITRQHSAPRWRGHRVYILGKPREWWTCLRSGHRYSPLDGRTFALCSVCLPCPDCGSTDQRHVVCGGAS